jgi:hypothetical protein
MALIGERDVEEDNQSPHSKINTWTSKAREKNTEINLRRRKSSSRRNVASTIESQVVENRVSVM